MKIAALTKLPYDDASTSALPATGRLMRLEYLRGGASLYILLHHYVRHNLPDHRFVARFFVFGQAAVMLFFLLSGFVIHYASLGQRPEMTFRDYFMRRFRRIFPIFTVALALAYAAACLDSGGWVNPRIGELALNLLQLQDRARDGNWAAPYMHNAPLWSLSYEWWFYMLYFPLYKTFSRRPERLKLAVLAISIVGVLSDWVLPNPLSHIAGYLVLWWFGVELAREYVVHGAVTLSRQWISILSIAIVTALWSIPLLLRDTNSAVDWYHHPGLTVRHFVATGSLILAAWLWYMLGLVGFDRLSRPFAPLAAISYSLYVMHLPMLVIAAHWGGTGFVGLVWVLPVTFFCCWLAEGPMQRKINYWFRPLDKRAT